MVLRYGLSYAQPAFFDSVHNNFLDIYSNQNSYETDEEPSQQVLNLRVGNPICEEHEAIADEHEHDFLEQLRLILGSCKKWFHEAVVGYY